MEYLLQKLEYRYVTKNLYEGKAGNKENAQEKKWLEVVTKEVAEKTGDTQHFDMRKLKQTVDIQSLYYFICFSDTFSRCKTILSMN